MKNSAKVDDHRLKEYDDLFCKIPPLNKCAISVFKRHIMDRGCKYIKDHKPTQSNQYSFPQALIPNLINLHQDTLKIVKTQFSDKGLYRIALSEAFQDIMNKQYYTSAVLARYANDILQKGTKIVVDDINDTMDQIVTLFGYIKDKGKYAVSILLFYFLPQMMFAFASRYIREGLSMLSGIKITTKFIKKWGIGKIDDW